MATLTLDWRLLAKVSRLASENPVTGCWEWLGARNSKGYGLIDGAPARSAHKAVFLTLAGPYSDDLELDHLCRVRHCVNPEHLEPVTRTENQQRGLHGVAMRTHCAKGHPFAGENLVIRSGTGQRCCRECRRDLKRRQRAAAKASA